MKIEFLNSEQKANNIEKAKELIFKARKVNEDWFQADENCFYDGALMKNYKQAKELILKHKNSIIGILVD